MTQSNVLMARQPIFNSQHKVVAYELLYRSSQPIGDMGSEATSDVILAAYTSISVEGSRKQVPAFINLTYDLIVNQQIPEMPRDKVVFEVLEDVEVDEPLIAGVKALIDKGYKVALDDFEFDEKYHPLLEMVQIVKVDVLAHTEQELAEQVAKLAPYNITLLAEKIETHEMMSYCLSLGFKMFQGYFLSKPKVVTGRKVKPGQVAMLQLIAELNKPDSELDTLEALIAQDPLLTFKFLRLVNSTAYSLVREINSIKQAIVLLGLNEVRKWATLIAMVSDNSKPEELSRQLLIRGKMCEQVAILKGHDNPSAFLMAGMMSGLNALLDIETPALLEQLPIGDDIKAAIVSGEGTIGDVLNNTKHFERGEWEMLSPAFDAELFDQAYRHSIEWSAESMLALGER